MTVLATRLAALPPELRERLGPVERYLRTKGANGMNHLWHRQKADAALAALLDVLEEQDRTVKTLKRDYATERTDHEGAWAMLNEAADRLALRADCETDREQVIADLRTAKGKP